MRTDVGVVLLRVQDRSVAAYVYAILVGAFQVVTPRLVERELQIPFCVEPNGVDDVGRSVAGGLVLHAVPPLFVDAIWYNAYYYQVEGSGVQVCGEEETGLRVVAAYYDRGRSDGRGNQVCCFFRAVRLRWLRDWVGAGNVDSDLEVELMVGVEYERAVLAVDLHICVQVCAEVSVGARRVASYGMCAYVLWSGLVRPVFQRDVACYRYVRARVEHVFGGFEACSSVFERREAMIYVHIGDHRDYEVFRRRRIAIYVSVVVFRDFEGRLRAVLADKVIFVSRRKVRYVNVVRVAAGLVDGTCEGVSYLPVAIGYGAAYVL